MISKLMIMGKSGSSKITEFYFRMKWLFCALGVVVIVALLLILFFSKQTIQQNTMEEAKQTLEKMTNFADERMRHIEAAADSLIPQIESHLTQPDMMFEYSRMLPANHPDIKGCSVSFEPYYFMEKGRYFSPYSYKNNGRIDTEQEGDDEYNYFKMDWYKAPRKLGRKCWIEPYEETNTTGIIVHEVMTSYCQPIHDAKGKAVGVLSADVPLEWLSNQVKSQHPMPQSYCMLLGVKGTYIVHPDNEKQLKKTIFDTAEELADSALAKLGKEMIGGETGYKSITIDDDQRYIFYMPFHQTGWSIALVCPDEVILSDYYKLIYASIPLFIISLVLILLPIFYRKKKDNS